MAQSFTPTGPGLNYDPRRPGLGKFYQVLEKLLGKAKAVLSKPVPKPKDFQNPQPVKDPGPPTLGTFPNPRLKSQKGTYYGR